MGEGTFQVQRPPVHIHTPGKNENDGFKEQKETEQWSGVGEGQSRVKWGQKDSKDPGRVTIMGVLRGVTC